MDRNSPTIDLRTSLGRVPLTDGLNTVGKILLCCVFFLLAGSCGDNTSPPWGPSTTPPSTPEITPTSRSEPADAHPFSSALVPELEATSALTPESTDARPFSSALAPEPTPAYTSERTTPTFTPVEIFERVSPSIAFIETELWTGSGVLINDGYIVTNAHVLWPLRSARVTFPNGSEFQDVPLLGWDLIADVAVLGPIKTSESGVKLSDGENLPIGTTLFLIGYPAETEQFPEPTVGQGILSRVREWKEAGITYLQTDSSIVGGQSGGALVSEVGEVIGISGLGFTEANFAMVASAADLKPRVQQLINGGDPSGLGTRRIATQGGMLQHYVTLDNYWSGATYLIDEPVGTVIDLELMGDNDGGFSIFDVYGYELVAIDDNYTGIERGSYTIQHDEPQFLFIWQSSLGSGDFTLESSHRLVRLNDPDDWKQVSPGQSIKGNIDFPADYDSFQIHLQEGEIIEVTVKSSVVDSLLMIDYDTASDNQVIVDDDSGGGLIGLDASAVYRAPHSGRFVLQVSDANSYAPGGYILTVNRADQNASVTTTTWDSVFGGRGTLTPTSSDFGLTEIRSAFAGLPPTFEEADPTTLDISLEGLGLGSYFTDLAVFLSSLPFEMIMAAAGQMSDTERQEFDAHIAAIGAIEDATSTYLAAFLTAYEDIEIHDAGILDLPAIGTSSIAMYADMTIEGVRLRVDIVSFRRGNLVTEVYSYYLPDTQPIVPIYNVASLLDTEMSDIILAR